MPEKKSGLVDKLAGKVKAAAGNIAGHRDLAEEGELQQAKGARADEAARLEAQAEQAADEARTKAEVESNAVEQARLQAEIDEAERLDDIERQRGAEEARAASLADRRGMGGPVLRPIDVTHGAPKPLACGPTWIR